MRSRSSSRTGQKLSLSSLLAQSDNGAILVTSRSADVARRLVGREQDIVEIGAMINNEATQLLQKKLRDAQQDGLAQLVKALDCIPLAIIQAAAYMNRSGPRMPVMKYIVSSRQSRDACSCSKTRLWIFGGMLNSVFATWQISFEHIRSKRPSAACLLSFMSFFNRQGIPEFMIRHYLDEISDGQNDSLYQGLEAEARDFEDDMAMLRAFSLVARRNARTSLRCTGWSSSEH